MKLENAYLVYTEGELGIMPVRLFTSAAAAVDFARTLLASDEPGESEMVFEHVGILPFVYDQPGEREIIGPAAFKIEEDGKGEQLPP